ncbi:hypothetical protein [Lysobacter enzymogenes]|uniref:hypothetical protein n=1 Tax=Lysobacter enzymogenes TaxID=69 RepID=UPI001A97061F|nr:hypothetical protein [Lysobacter enzymogenes]QQP97942.1 hypothetical protein JHW38_08045 [Lysobacter enzymogenes]
MRRAIAKGGKVIPAWLNDHPDRMLNTAEAAVFTGYSVAHMRKMRCANAGPPWIVLPTGYGIRYRLGDLKKWAGITQEAA